MYDENFDPKNHESPISETDKVRRAPKLVRVTTFDKFSKTHMNKFDQPKKNIPVVSFTELMGSTGRAKGMTEAPSPAILEDADLDID